MRKLLLLLFFPLTALGQQNYSAENNLSQIYKAYNVGMYANKKQLTNIRYYYITNDTAILLPLFKNRIFLDSSYLKLKSINLMALYKGKKIIFKVFPDDFYYVNILVKPHVRSQTKYIISLGTEYETSTEASKRKFIIKN